MNKLASLKKKTLLVVEDDQHSRLLISQILSKLDINVVEAVTGEEALEVVKDKKIEGMLLDIALGTGITGLDLGKQLKTDQRFKDTPMVAVTAYEKGALAGFEESGFTGYLQKPYSSADLRAMLTEQSLRKKDQRNIL